MIAVQFEDVINNMKAEIVILRIILVQFQNTFNTSLIKKIIRVFVIFEKS